MRRKTQDARRKTQDTGHGSRIRPFQLYIHEGGLEFMELGQVVIFREVFEQDDRLQYDKTRPYKHFPALTEKLGSRIGVWVILPILCIALVAWVNPLADKTKAGNRSYHKELYDEAMTKYTEVLVDLPNSPHIHLNIGSAAYKKEDYEEAFKSYTKAASLASDPMLESKAYYNLGNCKYRQGRLKENTNLGEAISLYREALDYYKQALDKNSEDTNAKYNHEFVERKIKELLDKMKQEQQQQPQQQQQEGEQQNQQEQEGQSEQQDGNQEQTQAAEAQQQETQEGSKEEQEQREGLTAEEARMLLDSLKDEELSQLRKKQDGRFPRVLKDW